MLKLARKQNITEPPELMGKNIQGIPSEYIGVKMFYNCH